MSRVTISLKVLWLGAALIASHDASAQGHQSGRSRYVAPGVGEIFDPVEGRKQLSALQLDLRRVEREHSKLLDLYQDLVGGLRLEGHAWQSYFEPPYEMDREREALDSAHLDELNFAVSQAEDLLAMRRRQLQGLGGGPLDAGQTFGNGLGGLASGAGLSSGAPRDPRDLGRYEPDPPSGSDRPTTGLDDLDRSSGTRDEVPRVSPGRSADGWHHVAAPDSLSRGPDYSRDSTTSLDPIQPAGPGASVGSSEPGDPYQVAPTQPDPETDRRYEADARLTLQRMGVSLKRDVVTQFVSAASDQTVVARMQLQAAEHLVAAMEEDGIRQHLPTVEALRRRARDKFEATLEAVGLALDQNPKNLEMMFYKAKALEGLFHMDIATGSIALESDDPAKEVAFSSRFQDVLSAYKDVEAGDSRDVIEGTEQVGPWNRAAEAARQHLRWEQERTERDRGKEIRSIQWDRPEQVPMGVGRK